MPEYPIAIGLRINEAEHQNKDPETDVGGNQRLNLVRYGGQSTPFNDYTEKRLADPAKINQKKRADGKKINP